MYVVDHEFEHLVSEMLGTLPEKYVSQMDNVAITWEHEPSLQQREQLRLRRGHTLFGLYEGIPLPARGAGYTMVLPDKITIFKRPIEQSVRDFAGLKAQIRKTLWHEIAHHFGLDHDQIDRLGGS